MLHFDDRTSNLVLLFATRCMRRPALQTGTNPFFPESFNAMPEQTVRAPFDSLLLSPEERLPAPDHLLPKPDPKHVGPPTYTLKLIQKNDTKLLETYKQLVDRLLPGMRTRTRKHHLIHAPNTMSIALLEHGDVIGGATFRIAKANKLIVLDILILVVAQYIGVCGRGHGTRIVNYLKVLGFEIAKRENHSSLTILTQADSGRMARMFWARQGLRANPHALQLVHALFEWDRSFEVYAHSVPMLAWLDPDSNWTLVDATLSARAQQMAVPRGDSYRHTRHTPHVQVRLRGCVTLLPPIQPEAAALEMDEVSSRTVLHTLPRVMCEAPLETEESAAPISCDHCGQTKDDHSVSIVECYACGKHLHRSCMGYPPSPSFHSGEKYVATKASKLVELASVKLNKATLLQLTEQSVRAGYAPDAPARLLVPPPLCAENCPICYRCAVEIASSSDGVDATAGSNRSTMLTCLLEESIQWRGSTDLAEKPE